MKIATENSFHQIAAGLPPRRQQFCAKCNSISAVREKSCPQCGKKLETVKRIRVTGALSVLLGAILLVVMSWLALWIYNAVAGSPGANSFHGNSQDIGLIIVVFGVVLTLCFFSILAGLWQVIFGTRNKILKYIVVGLGLIFIGIGLMFSLPKF